MISSSQNQTLYSLKFMSMLLRASLVLSLACLALARKPNLLFIIAESTDAKVRLPRPLPPSELTLQA